VYVTTVLISVRTLGAGGVTAATIAGQLTLSVVLDQLGVALLAAGVVLVVRN
jgi:bacterial/archaeal transporter family-2 protein